MPDLRIIIAHAIRAERNRQKLSQQDLAERLGWSRPVITKIENGTRSVGAHELLPICQALDVTVPTLLHAADPADRRTLGI